MQSFDLEQYCQGVLHRCEVDYTPSGSLGIRFKEWVPAQEREAVKAWLMSHKRVFTEWYDRWYEQHYIPDDWTDEELAEWGLLIGPDLVLAIREVLGSKLEYTIPD